MKLASFESILQAVEEMLCDTLVHVVEAAGVEYPLKRFGILLAFHDVVTTAYKLSRFLV
jgi:hypothetical protein